MSIDEKAIAIRKQLVADRERVLGPDHPDTLIAKVKLQELVYMENVIILGLNPEAKKQLAADCARVLGPNHPDTLSILALNQCYSWTGSGECLSMQAERQLAADCERILGPDHPATRTVRESLALREMDALPYPDGGPSWIG